MAASSWRRQESETIKRMHNSGLVQSRANAFDAQSKDNDFSSLDSGAQRQYSETMVQLENTGRVRHIAAGMDMQQDSDSQPPQQEFEHVARIKTSLSTYTDIKQDIDSGSEGSVYEEPRVPTEEVGPRTPLIFPMSFHRGVSNDNDDDLNSEELTLLPEQHKSDQNVESSGTLTHFYKVGTLTQLPGTASPCAVGSMTPSSSACSISIDDSEASIWGDVFVTRIQAWFRSRAQRKKQKETMHGEAAAEAERHPSLEHDLDQLSRDGFPEAFEERVRTRAYYLFVDGSQDDKKNYFTALKIELDLFHNSILRQQRLGCANYLTTGQLLNSCN